MISNEQIAHDLTLLALPDAINNDDILEDVVEKGLAQENSKASQYLAAYKILYKSFLEKINNN